jgi:hypothetical protein
MEANMPRFVIEREIPEIGTADRDALRGASQKSNSVLTGMREQGKNILWEQSYVTDDKIFCIYHADSEDLVHEHARESGFPATVVTEVRKRIDPITAED